ncbi:MAG: hypothetical protein J1F03_11115, partial [Oscillospiraceae bacterium]|nr:hypothetical protein [Oscillospiraceae bacterium]
MGKFKNIKSLLTKVCAGLCAAALLVISPHTSVFGGSAIDSIQDEIDKIQKDNESRKKQIENLGSDIANNEKAMKLINEQIDGINAEITKYGELILAKQNNINTKIAEIEAAEKSISEKELEIDGRKIEIAAMQAENKLNLERFAELARLLYINDVSD